MAQFKKEQLNTHLITINSNSNEATQVPDIWSSVIIESATIDRKLDTEKDSVDDSQPEKSPILFQRRSFSGSLRGKCLSMDDFTGIEQFLIKFVCKCTLDWIAANIRDWERDIVSAKRGLSSRLLKVGLKYFGGKNSTGASHFVEPVSGLTLFHFHSTEMIMRRLIDYAIMIRDYKYALGIMELLKKDFSSSDKFIKYYAGVQVTLVYLGNDCLCSIDYDGWKGQCGVDYR